MEVFLVYKQSDMTEGRGAMVLDSIWSTKVGAEMYCSYQLGVMGTSGNQFHEQRSKMRQGNVIAEFHAECLGWFCEICHPNGGDWQVRPTQVMEWG